MGITEINNLFTNFDNLSWLDLTGGEVTLREDLFEIVKIILRNSKNLLIFHASTNGQLPEKVIKLTKQILKANIVPVVSVSVDGPQVVNDNLKGVAGAYVKSIETFKQLRDFGKGFYYLSCTISDYNINYIDDFILGLTKDVPHFSLGDLHFNIFHNSPHYYKNSDINGLFNVSFKKLKKYLSMSQRGSIIKRFLESRYAEGLSKYFSEKKIFAKCQALNSTCFINPYGEIYPCGVYNRLIDNLRQYNYNVSKVWNNQNILNVKKDIEIGMCPGCWSPCEAYPAILGSLFNQLGRKVKKSAFAIMI
jgi:MoaA/NifB/PqqE/SkfB family radical SAM enzyme